MRTLAEKAAKEQALKPKKFESEGNSADGGASSSNRSTGVDKDEEEEVVQGKKKKRGSQHSARERVIDDTDEEPKGGKGSKSKKRGGRSKGGISLLAGESGAGATKAGQGSLAKEDADVPSQELFAEKILEWYPDMDSAGIGESRPFRFMSWRVSWLLSNSNGVIQIESKT